MSRQSGFLRSNVIGPISPGRFALGSSTIAPLGILPAVGDSLRERLGLPGFRDARYGDGPLRDSVNEAIRRPTSGVMMSVPPISDGASPSDETVMSIRDPRLMKGGRSAGDENSGDVARTKAGVADVDSEAIEHRLHRLLREGSIA